MQTILITGASGLVGKHLMNSLLAQGHSVHTLTRSKFPFDKKVKQFLWNIEKNKLDENAFVGVTAIVHLAGAGVADERWTNERKNELWNSRIHSTQLLFKTLKKIKQEVKVIVSASAVGFYGDRSDALITENAKRGDGFLADLCVAWEKEVEKFSTLGIREVRGRIGIVLAKEGGALPEMTKTFPFGMAGYFKKESLFYPWIHIDDLCRAFLFCLENETCAGAFNFTSPHAVTHKALMQAALSGLKSKAILTPVPPFALRLAMGEMATMLLNSQRCVPEKLLKQGFQFRYETVEGAMGSLK